MLPCVACCVEEAVLFNVQYDRLQMEQELVELRNVDGARCGRVAWNPVALTVLWCLSETAKVLARRQRRSNATSCSSSC